LSDKKTPRAGGGPRGAAGRSIMRCEGMARLSQKRFLPAPVPKENSRRADQAGRGQRVATGKSIAVTSMVQGGGCPQARRARPPRGTAILPSTEPPPARRVAEAIGFANLYSSGSPGEH